MFYSDTILSKKGPLATLWLAAHMEKKLSRSAVNSTDIPAAIKSLLKSTMEASASSGGALPPMALRLKGQLLLGVVRIYVRKTRYLLEDCTEAVSKLRIGLQESSTNKNISGAEISINSSLARKSINQKASITIEAEQGTSSQDLLADLAEMWRPFPIQYGFHLKCRFPIEMEELRKESQTINSSSHQQIKAAQTPFDIFSFFTEEDLDPKMEVIPFETLFPPTPLKDSVDRTLLINPKLSLDRTLFGEDIIQDSHLSQIEVARRIPESPIQSIASLSALDLSGHKDAYLPHPVSPLFEQDELDQKDENQLFSPSIQPSPTLLNTTPMKKSLSFLYDDSNSITIPSPIEATRILGSPENVSEIAKILAFGNEDKQEKIHDSEEQENVFKRPGMNPRKKHKTSKSYETISLGGKRSLVSFYMDPTTELTSAMIQAQLGSGGLDTLQSSDELVDYNIHFNDEIVKNLTMFSMSFFPTQKNKENTESTFKLGNTKIHTTDYRESLESSSFKSYDIDSFYPNINDSSVNLSTNRHSNMAQSVLGQDEETNVTERSHFDQIDSLTTQKVAINVDRGSNEQILEGDQDFMEDMPFHTQNDIIDSMHIKDVNEIVNYKDQLKTVDIQIHSTTENLDDLETYNDSAAFSKVSIGILEAFENTSESTNTLTLDKILNAKQKFHFTRQYAALSFYQVLNLASKGVISVDQKEPFGEIKLYHN